MADTDATLTSAERIRERGERIGSKFTDKERRILDMWPRFDDGEPVMVGDVVDSIGGEVCMIEAFDRIVNLYGASGLLHLGFGERVKRPAPEVLDADGAPIKEGDAVYEVETGDKYKVEVIFGGTTEPDFPSHTIRCRKRGDCTVHLFAPEMLTHARPVLDADGAPIRVGDEVFGVRSFIRHRIAKLEPHGHKTEKRLYGGACVVYEDGGWDFARSVIHCNLYGWDRLWADMANHDPETEICGLNRDEFVRRAKALAGVE